MCSWVACSECSHRLRESHDHHVTGKLEIRVPMDQLLREQLRPEEGKGQCVLHCTCHVQKHILCTTAGKGVPPSSSRGSHWPGLPAAQLDQLFADEATPSGKGEGLSAGVSTEKTSMAHSAVITARDAAFQASPHILHVVPGVCVCHLLALVDYPHS